jgi:hypothetical protein
MAEWQLAGELVLWITQLSGPLHRRLAGRLLPIFTGMLFAQGRKTVAGWLRGGGLGHDFRAYYYFLGSLGRKAQLVGSLLLRRAVDVVAPEGRLLFALDDTPTARYGPHVEGAGVHHNPTPGPAEQKFLYGHVWVTVARVVRHPRWGVIGLPLRACLYVRKKQIALISQLYKVPFQTKLEQAAGLVEWLAAWLKYLGQPLWLVVDGAYAKKPFLRRATAAAPAARDTAAPRPQAEVRPRQAQPGQACRPPAGLADRRLHPLRQDASQDLQDVPGDLRAGRRRHPRGAGA